MLLGLLVGRKECEFCYCRNRRANDKRGYDEQPENHDFKHDRV